MTWIVFYIKRLWDAHEISEKLSDLLWLSSHKTIPTNRSFRANCHLSITDFVEHQMGVPCRRRFRNARTFTLVYEAKTRTSGKLMDTPAEMLTKRCVVTWLHTCLTISMLCLQRLLTRRKNSHGSTCIVVISLLIQSLTYKQWYSCSLWHYHPKKRKIANEFVILRQII